MNNPDSSSGRPALACPALAAARASPAPPPEWARAALVAAVCATHPADCALAPGALACAAGESCEAARLSGGAVVGAALRRRQTISHVLCALCIVRHVQNMVDQRAPPRALPFAVRVGEGPDAVHPRDCHPVVRDGAACVPGNMVTLAALRMRWDGARLRADGLGDRDTPDNGGLCAYTFNGDRWTHVACADAQRLVAPLVSRGPRWQLRSVSGEAGLPHLGAGDAAAWDAAVGELWAREPRRRLWLGALADAAAVGGDDARGPWPGDLPDVLAAAGEVSAMAVFNSDYSAPAGCAAVVIAVKTMPWPAYRRECAAIFARMSGRVPGLGPLLRASLAHVLLGTWPVPAARPTLADRRRRLGFLELADELSAPLVTVAVYYLRYVAERARGAAWAARPARDARFWAEFEDVLPEVRAAADALGGLGFDAAVARAFAEFAARDRAGLVAWLGADCAAIDEERARVAAGKKGAALHAFRRLVLLLPAPAAHDRAAAVAARVHAWIAHGRQTHAAPVRATAAALFRGGPPAPGRVAEFCPACRRLVHNELGARGPCNPVKKARAATGACCCALKAHCTQRRARGCCCATKSVAAFSLDDGTLRCRRKLRGVGCNAVVAQLPLDGRVLLLPAHGRSAYVACADCGKVCNYRRAHHMSSGYHCGCAAAGDADPCVLCGGRKPGGVWTLQGDGRPTRLCPKCVFHSHTLQMFRRPWRSGEAQREEFMRKRRLTFVRHLR